MGIGGCAGIMSSDDYPIDTWIKKIFEGWFDPCELSTGEMFDGLGSSWEDKILEGNNE